MSCECNQQNSLTSSGGLDFMQIQQLTTSDSSLHWFVMGVRTGLQMHAAEQAKWQRLGVILALGFGVMTFLHRFGE
jgi:hypothetical protein